MGAGWYPCLERFFWQEDDLGISFSREGYERLVRITVDRWFSTARLV